MILLKELELHFVDHVLKSTKNYLAVKVKQNHIRPFRIQVFSKKPLKSTLFTLQQTLVHLQNQQNLFFLVSAQLKRNQRTIKVLIRKKELKQKETSIYYISEEKCK